MEQALKQFIRDWVLENKDVRLNNEQVDKMYKGVAFWFDVTAPDSVSTAYDELISE
jgi:hypothetical protein